MRGAPVERRFVHESRLIRAWSTSSPRRALLARADAGAHSTESIAAICALRARFGPDRGCNSDFRGGGRNGGERAGLADSAILAWEYVVRRKDPFHPDFANRGPCTARERPRGVGGPSFHAGSLIRWKNLSGERNVLKVVAGAKRAVVGAAQLDDRLKRARCRIVVIRSRLRSGKVLEGAAARRRGAGDDLRNGGCGGRTGRFLDRLRSRPD